MENFQIKGGFVAKKRQISKNPEQLRAMRDQGTSWKEIAQLDGVSCNTVSRRAKRLGISPCPHLLLRARHCLISPDLLQLLDGLILGGGCLMSHHPSLKTAFYTQASTELKYLEWIREELRGFGVDPEGEITRMVTRSPGGKKYRYWRYASRSYYELAEVLNRWYGGQGKDVPQDIELTPRLALLWYLRGGHFSFGSLDVWRGKPRICFSVGRYSLGGIQYLLGELKEVGCDPRLYRGASSCKVVIPFSDVPRFLDYIGPCPKELEKVFGHKWRIATRR